MGDVIQFDRQISVDKVLEGAKEELGGVILIGYTKEGEEYFASTY